VFKDSSLVQNNFTLRRITQSSFTEGTGQSRVLLWKMSIAASMERPVFGYGANNMRIPLDRHHDYNLQEDWFDSAHNKFFDELLSHGFVGLLIYLAFLILVFRHIFGLRKKDLWESLALLGLFVGYVVQSLFIFDSLVVGLLFVFVLAWLFTTEDSKKQIFAKTLRPWVAYLLCAVLVIGGLLVYLRAIPPARDTASAYRMLSQDMGQAIRLFEKVEHQAFFSYDIIAPTMAEGAVMVFSEPERYAREDLERYADLVIRMYRKAIDASGGYSKFYINLAKLYQQFDSVLDNGAYLGESFALLDEAAMISPGRIDVYYARAQGYYNMGDTDQAAAELQKALEFGVRQDKIYMRLAQIYVRKGSAEEFLEAFKAVSETGGSFSLGGLEQYARILVERGVWDGALAVFLKMHELAPNDIDIRFNIALTYKQLGEREKAAEWAGSIIDLNPFKADEMNAFILTL
jgi:tetratricopeptide (TPR) repeat protein